MDLITISAGVFALIGSLLGYFQKVKQDRDTRSEERRLEEQAQELESWLKERRREEESTGLDREREEAERLRREEDLAGPDLGREEARRRLKRVLEDDEIPGRSSYRPTVSRRAASPISPILVVFTVLVLMFGVLTLVRYWQFVLGNPDLLLYGGWLFLTMIAGMFVQVISTNYGTGKPLFEADASQLIFPVLFSLIVFYPIWAIAAEAPKGLFVFHAAFLNGYFWKSAVAAARPPEPAPAG